jgi:hypothetical protein
VRRERQRWDRHDRRARRQRHGQIDALLTARLIDVQLAHDRRERDELGLQDITPRSGNLECVGAINTRGADVDRAAIRVEDRDDDAG